MAMYSMLRRASSSVLPLAFRAMASPTTFYGAISDVRLSHRLIGTILPPSARLANSFATKMSADENLLRTLETEIQYVEQEDHDRYGVGGTHSGTSWVALIVRSTHIFKIRERFSSKKIPSSSLPRDNPGKRTILLKREYKDEIITGQLHVPIIVYDGSGSSDRDAIDDSDDIDAYYPRPCDRGVPLVVNISKRNGLTLQFGLRLKSDTVTEIPFSGARGRQKISPSLLR